jgi:hypothetical protein
MRHRNLQSRRVFENQSRTLGSLGTQTWEYLAKLSFSNVGQSVSQPLFSQLQHDPAERDERRVLLLILDNAVT